MNPGANRDARALNAVNRFARCLPAWAGIVWLSLSTQPRKLAGLIPPLAVLLSISSGVPPRSGSVRRRPRSRCGPSGR